MNDIGDGVYELYAVPEQGLKFLPVSPQRHCWHTAGGVRPHPDILDDGDIVGCTLEGSGQRKPSLLLVHLDAPVTRLQNQFHCHGL